MELRVFTVYDSKAQAFLAPFYARTVGEAERNFMGACSDQKSQFYHHPEDFCLMEIGTFDEDSGRLRAKDGPINHGMATVYHPRSRKLWSDEVEKSSPKLVKDEVKSD